MATKIYSYGCKPPIGEDKKRLDECLYLVHKYYNLLIEIERNQRTRINESRLRYSVRLTTATNRREELENELEQLRSQIKRDGRLPSLVERTREVKRELTTIRQEQTAARQELRTNAIYLEEQNRIYQEGVVEHKRVYANSPLFWPAKNHTKQSVELAVSNSFGDIQFRRWSRDGVFYCQVMNGINIPTLYAATDTRVQVHRTEHPKLCLVKIRCGSDENRNPIWITMKTYIHRPLPDNAMIMGVQIVRKQGTQFRYSDGKYHPNDEYFVQFTVRYTEATNKDIPKQIDAVGIDIGWRLTTDNNLRVAKWYDTDGNSGEYILPRSLLNRWLKCRDLQSIRDNLFNEVIAQLREYCSSVTILPTFLGEISPYLHAWKSIYRLVRLVDSWIRHGGDDEIYNILTHWRNREAHLHQWQYYNELKAQRIRKNMYRIWAKKLNDTYKTVIMEDFDISTIRRNPNPENEAERVSKFWRNAAAIGLLRQLVTQKTNSVLLPAEYTTMDCHVCGGVNEWDRSELVHQCRHCKAVWDQDENAAKNLLQRYLAARSSEGDAPPDDTESEVKPTGRWQRRKANRSQTGS